MNNIKKDECNSEKSLVRKQENEKSHDAIITDRESDDMKLVSSRESGDTKILADRESGDMKLVSNRESDDMKLVPNKDSDDTKTLENTQSSNKLLSRTFKLEDVEIETLYGEKILVKMWVSNNKLCENTIKVHTEIFKCEKCSKEFDRRQKMLLHSRFHKNI